MRPDERSSNRRAASGRRRSDLNFARFVAMILDLSLPLVFVFYFVDFQILLTQPETLPPLLAAALALHFILLATGYLAFKRTLGQWIFELRLSRSAGQTSGTYGVLVRSALLALIGPLDELALLMAGREKSLIDRLSRTGIENAKVDRERRRPALVWLRMLGMLCGILLFFHLLIYASLNLFALGWFADQADRVIGKQEIAYQDVEAAGWEEILLPGFSLKLPFADRKVFSEFNSLSVAIMPGDELESLILQYRHGPKSMLFLLSTKSLTAEQGDVFFRVKDYFDKEGFWRRFWQSQITPLRITTPVVNFQVMAMRYMFHVIPFGTCISHHGRYQILFSEAGWSGIMAEQPRLDESLAHGDFYDMRYHLDILSGVDHYLRLDMYLPAGSDKLMDEVYSSITPHAASTRSAALMYERYRHYRDLNQAHYPSEYFLALAALLDKNNQGYMQELIDRMQTKRVLENNIYRVLEMYRPLKVQTMKIPE